MHFVRVLALASLAAAGAAQSTDPSVLRDACGIQVRGDRLMANGPRYKALFDACGVELTPALGAAAPRNFPLAFELESAGRGGVELDLDLDAEPTSEGMRVEYDRGVVHERYDVLPIGIEQSFLFERLPVGEGDLVVRGRVRTELALRASGDGAEGLRFELPGVGGVRIGGVTGIDADGRTARGEIGMEGEHLRLSLPASFVDGARLPLVLDPVIAPEFDIAAGFDDSGGDAAYDATNDLFLVAWHREFSALNVDIRVARVDDSGPVGGVFAASASGAIARNPTVANVNLTDRFLVAWEASDSWLGPWSIGAVAVDADDGQVSGELTVASAGDDSHRNPDAGGEATTVDDDALLIWEPNVAAGYAGAQVRVPAAGDPTIQSTFAFGDFLADGAAKISKSGGTTGRLCAVWRRSGFLLNPGGIYAAVIDRNGNVLEDGAGVVLDTTHDQAPEVDGDGTSWLVAFESAASAGQPRDVRCARLVFDAGALTADAPVDLTGNEAVDELEPAVAVTGARTVVVWSVDGAGFLEQFLEFAELDPATCKPCVGGSQTLAKSGGDNVGRTQLASKHSGGGGADDREVLAVFDRSTTAPPYSGDVQGAFVDALGSGGAIELLGGGCTGGGDIDLVGGPASIGNPSFAAELANADGFATLALLNLTANPVPFPCGSCDAMLLDFVFMAPIVHGSAQVPLPIPCAPELVGAALTVQWISLLTLASPCPLVPNVAVSDRMRYTIGK